jgi:hypothetical protein
MTSGAGTSTFELLAGAARCEITPPAGLVMDGYSDRAGVSTGVHDPLWARALVLVTPARRLILVSCDLIGIDSSIVRSVRESLEATMSGDCGVFICATHTHSGPAGTRAPVDERVVGIVTRGILSAAEAAMQRPVPARVGTGWGQAPRVGANRRDPTTPYDPQVGVLRVDTADDRPLAALVNFACHPTVLGADNLLYSADYPGAVVASLECSIGREIVALFANAAAGDISTRFTRSASTFAEAERLGGIVGRAAAEVYSSISPYPATHLAFATRAVDLPPPPVPSTEIVAAQLEKARQDLADAHTSGAPHGQVRIARTAVQGLERQLARTRQGVTQTIPAELGAFALDGIRAVTWPGEVFNAYAVELRRRAGGPVFVLGYTNGFIGYVPTPEAFAAGGYEATSARVGPEAGAMILETSLAMLRDVTTRA